MITKIKDSNHKHYKEQQHTMLGTILLGSGKWQYQLVAQSFEHHRPLLRFLGEIALYCRSSGSSVKGGWNSGQCSPGIGRGQADKGSGQYN